MESKDGGAAAGPIVEPEKALARHPRPARSRRPRRRCSYQDLSLAQKGAARHRGRKHGPNHHRLARKTSRSSRSSPPSTTPKVLEKLEHYTGERPLFDLYNVEDEIERALARRVEFEKRGLPHPRADRGDDHDRRQHRRLRGHPQFRRYDLQDQSRGRAGDRAPAAPEKSRGIIIIDFIDMESAEHRSAVLAELNKALARDRTRISVNGFTGLGLVEMTRKRTREIARARAVRALHDLRGRGVVKTAQTVCYEVLRESCARRASSTLREFRILASQSVIDLFLEEESQSLAMLGDFIGKPVSMQVETSYGQEQFDIILM